MLFKLIFLGFLALCAANPTGQRHDVYGPPEFIEKDIEDDQGSVVFAEGYPAGVTKEACPNFPFCGPSPSSTEKPVQIVSTTTPNHRTAPIVPSIQLDTVKYLPGIDVAVCPNYPFCDQNKTPKIGGVNSEGTINIVYVPIGSGKPAQIPAPSTVGAQPGFQFSVNSNVYPEGVSPETCPNYPYCEGVQVHPAPTVTSDTVIVEGGVSHQPTVQHHFASNPTEAGQFGTKRIVVSDYIENQPSFQGEGGVIAYPPGVTAETCPNYPFCNHEIPKNGESLSIVYGPSHRDGVDTNQNTEVSKYPEGVNPSDCPNYPFCDSPIVAQEGVVKTPNIITQSGVQISANLNVLPEGVNRKTCPNYPYCDGVQVPVDNVVQHHAPTVTSDAVVVETAVSQEPTTAKPLTDGVASQPSSSQHVGTKPNVNTGIQQSGQWEGQIVAHPPGVTVVTCPNYPFCDGVTENDYVDKLPNTNTPQIFQLVVPVSKGHSTDGVQSTISYPEGVDAVSCPNYPFCTGGQVIRTNVVGDDYKPTHAHPTAIKYNIHHGLNTPQFVVQHGTPQTGVHHGVHHGVSQGAFTNSGVHHVSGTQHPLHQTGVHHVTHHVVTQEAITNSGVHHVSGSHHGIPHNIGFPHGGHHKSGNQHKFPAGVTPEQCPNYPFCDGILTNVDQIHHKVVKQPAFKPIVIDHKGLLYPPGVTPESCPNYPFCDGHEIHTKTNNQDVSSTPVTTTTPTPIVVFKTKTTPTPTTVSTTTAATSNGGYHYPAPKVKFEARQPTQVW